MIEPANSLLAIEGVPLTVIKEEQGIEKSHIIPNSPSDDMSSMVDLPNGDEGIHENGTPEESCIIPSCNDLTEMNGDLNGEHIEDVKMQISSPSALTTIPSGLPQLSTKSNTDHTQHKYNHVNSPPVLTSDVLTSTATAIVNDVLGGRSTPVDLLPTRLKRTLNDVEDLVTSSAKRSHVPSAFMSYNHHSPHLGSKWGSETPTTILFDQHNNNG